jgi:hypothetical protein
MMARGVTVLGVVLLVLGVAGILVGGAGYLSGQVPPAEVLPTDGRDPAVSLTLAGAFLLSVGMAVLAVGPRGGRG